MAFRQANFERLTKFNSLASSKLYSQYEAFRFQKVVSKSKEPKSQVFVPSGMRCKRKSWFRLRGVECDELKNPDMQLEFTAEVGTACHAVIQTNLEEMLGENWVSVKDYLALHPIAYTYELVENGHETKVSILVPPMHFSCDGIIKIGEVFYILEIKTCDDRTFNELTDVKLIHKDQANAYSTMLGISNVLFMYQSRLTGEIKVFEYTVSSLQQQEVLDSMKEIQELAAANIAPDKLDTAWGDYVCRNCEYSKKCRSWG